VTLYYITEARAKLRIPNSTLVQLTNDAGSGTTINSDVFTAVAEDVEAEVCGGLLKGFVHPITVETHGQDAFNAVVALCMHVLRWHLHMRKPETIVEGLAVDYEKTLKRAVEMAKGKLAMPGDPPVPRSGPEAPAAASTNKNNVSSSSRPASRNWTRESQGNA